MPTFTHIDGLLVHLQEARESVVQAYMSEPRELAAAKYHALLEHLNGAINVYLNVDPV